MSTNVSVPTTANWDGLPKGYPAVLVLDLAWGEMDAFQHINNVVYFRYFENSRIDYMRRIDWENIRQTTNIGPIIAAVSARFRKPLTYPDTIAVGTKVTAMEKDRFTLQHVIVSRKLGAIATEGEATVVTYDYQLLSKADIPDIMRKRILQLEAEAGNTLAPTNAAS